LTHSARDALRRVLIHDQADRDAISSQLLRYRTRTGSAGPTSSTPWRCIRRRDGRWFDSWERLMLAMP